VQAPGQELRVAGSKAAFSFSLVDFTLPIVNSYNVKCSLYFIKISGNVGDLSFVLVV